MRQITRPTAYLVLLMLFQLVLVGSGYACPVPSAHIAADMPASGMPMTGAEHPAPHPVQHERQHAPCQLPSSPNGCASMAACAPLALGVVAATGSAWVSARVAPLAKLLAAQSLSRAPELPPPKA